MYIDNNSKIIYFKGNNIDYKDVPNLFIPDGCESILLNVTKYQGEYYYYKSVNPQKLTNELIGTALAKRIGLDTVDYKIGKITKHANQLYAMSKILFEKEFTYHNCRDFYGVTRSTCLSFNSYVYLNDYSLLEKIEDYNTLLNILKLTALDLKMGQFDRHNMNLFLKIDDLGKVNLASIFDYGNSYSTLFGSTIYDNPFVLLRKNKISLFYFVKRFPEIKEYASFLLNISIDDIFDDIEKDYIVLYSNHERNYYRKLDKQHNKVLQKIIM